MPTIEINLVLTFVAFIWHYSLFCGYISDDHAAVAERKDIIPDSEKIDRGESFWVKRFNDGIVQFYQTRLFWKLGLKNKPFFWHLFSLGLHLVNTYLFYTFLEINFGHDIAIYGSAFWAINPMLNQNVVWISGRPYLMGTFLALIAMICWQQPYVFIPYYLLAVVTNISIILVPILMYIAHPDSWQTKLYIVVMLVAAAPFIVWKFNKRFLNGLIIDRENFRFKLRKLNTLSRVILYYTWSLFFPVRMGWYHQAGFSYNKSWEKFNYLTYAGLMLAFFLIVHCGVSGWWFLLGLLPVSNLYATNSFLQDRYLYFCSMGIAIILAPIFVLYPPLFWMALAFYGSRAYSYSRHLKNDEMLYRENWRNHPKSDYAVNNLSYFLIQQGRFDEARVVVERGLAIDSTNKMLWYNLGITYAAQGHFSNDEGKFRFIKALDCWKKCVQLEPRWAKPANDIKNMVKLLFDRGVLKPIPQSGANPGMEVIIPNIIGMKEMLDGTGANTNPTTTTAPTGT